MKILPVPVCGLADANSARTPEHPFDLGNEPFCIVEITLLAQVSVQRHQEDNSERVRPQITQTIRPNASFPHPAELLENKLNIVQWSRH